jgi:hypothetical protein
MWKNVDIHKNPEHPSCLILEILEKREKGENPTFPASSVGVHILLSETF